jgi:aminopeptidase N
MAKWWLSSRSCAAAVFLTTTATTTRSSSAFVALLGRRIHHSVLVPTFFLAGIPRSSSTTSSHKTSNSNVCYPQNTSPHHQLQFRGGSGALFSSSTNMASKEESPATTAPVEVFRAGYRPLPFLVSTIRMNFDIRDGQTTVTTDMTVKANPHYSSSPGLATSSDSDLQLDGETSSVTLQSIELDGTSTTDYEMDSRKLILHNVRDGSRIRTVVTLVPETNTELSGLYRSGGLYVTQCEAMGFRRITYYPDRPDNMAIFESVRVEAAAPLLLSNGNLVEQGVTTEGRNYAIWTDPFPKPSYLFAIVAGDLGVLADTFVTKSGRTVQLRIYSDHHNVKKLGHAMTSLINAMKWDEDKYGLEYDLDLYNIVAVTDFNMGAMENKSLNVFAAACVLAEPQTATDADFERVEGVVAHEYFHNWTGNRVTCRTYHVCLCCFSLFCECSFFVNVVVVAAAFLLFRCAPATFANK